jgi:hypothetical protein
MKKLLLALLFIPAVTFGRKIELGLNAGYNTTRYFDAYPQWNARGICISAKGLINVKKFQFGIGEDVGTLIFEPKYLTIEVPPKSTAQLVKAQPYIGRPYFHTYLLSNYVFSLKRVHIYTGANLGYFITRTSSSVIYYPNNDSTLPVKIKQIPGRNDAFATIGLQLGGSVDITRKIAVNAEFSPRRLGQQRPYLLPVTVGVRYKL